MKKLSLVFYGFLVFTGAAICVISGQMGYGGTAKPGSGFLPFWCGLLMALLALWLLVQEYRKKEGISTGAPQVRAEINPRKPLVILGAMVLYCLLFYPLGFIPASMLFLVILFRFVWQKRWGFSLAAAVGIDIGFYVVFQRLMEVRLPPGILQGILF